MAVKEKQNLLLIDGSNLAFRMFFALEMSNLRDGDGNPTWAVYGTIKALFDVIEATKPTAIAVAFDLPQPTYRHEVFEEYKANRPDDMPDDLKPQWALIKETFRKLHVPVLEEAGYEADDLIGILAKKAERHDMDVVILSGDKDLFQLVNDRTSIAMPRRGGGLDFYDTAKVIEKMGVRPDQVPDYKGIAGDSSDNIPGVKGLGPKAAIKLLGEYQTLEGIYENIAAVLPPKTQEKLVEQEDGARLSKYIATIILEEDGLKEKLDLEACNLTLPDVDELIAFLKQLRFTSILRRLPIVLKPFNNGELVKVDVGELPEETERTFNVRKNIDKWDSLDKEFKEVKDDKNFKPKSITTEKGLEDLVEKLTNLDAYSLDLETTGLNTLNCEIVGWALAHKEASDVNSYYIPVGHIQGEQLKADVVLNKLKTILEDESKKIIVQNAKFDLKILERYGVKIHQNFFDTMLASYVDNPSNKHGLKTQSKRVFDLKMTEIEDLIGTGKKQTLMSDAPIELVSDYACADAHITFKLHDHYLKKLDAREIKLLNEIEFPVISVLKDIENQGISLDVNFLSELSKDIHSKIDILQKRIFELAKEEFNIGSPKQLGVVMFEKLELPVVGKKKKTGSYSTDMSTLETLLHDYELSPENKEFIELIIEYRTHMKLASTYIDNLPALIAKEDNRLHSDFNQVVTTTGRLSSSNPNLQNIPIRSEYGRQIRKAFTAKDSSKVLLSADYSQIELRVLAHLADEKALIEAFNNDQDIHARTAMEIFGLKEDEVTSDHRRIGKTLNFALIYMQGPFATAKQLGISMSEAKKFIDTYFKVFPKVKPFMNKTIEDAHEHEYTETMFGRRRYFRNLNSNNKILQKEEERQAFNAGIQGSAADIMKMAMINLDKRLKAYDGANLILQVHDEMIVECDIGIKDEIKKIIVEEMSSATKLKVPLKVDIGEGNNWLEAH
jgi:DNA polymerase I